MSELLLQKMWLNLINKKLSERWQTQECTLHDTIYIKQKFILRQNKSMTLEVGIAVLPLGGKAG